MLFHNVWNATSHRTYNVAITDAATHAAKNANIASSNGLFAGLDPNALLCTDILHRLL